MNINYADQLYECNKCGFCLADCPTYKQTQDETYSARGILTIAEAVQNEELPFSKLFNDRLGSCIRCMACTQNCPSGIRPSNLIQETKEKLVNESGLDLPKKIFCKTIVKNQWLLGKTLQWGKTLGQFEGNVPKSKGKSFIKLLPEVLKVEKPKANIGFFVGCAINLWYPQIGLATVKLLTDAGFQVTIPRKQKCCSTPIQALGDFESSKSLMLENIKAFKGLDVIVTSCASCGLMLKKECERFGVPLQFRDKVKDITEFLVENNIRGATQSNSKSEKVTYHDPCHLNRGQDITEQPRQLIDSIKKYKLVEIENAKQCCGGGGTFRLFNSDLAEKIAQEKVESVSSSGASILATSCPGCIMQFNDVFEKANKSIKVKHIVELLAYGE